MQHTLVSNKNNVYAGGHAGVVGGGRESGEAGIVDGLVERFYTDVANGFGKIEFGIAGLANSVKSVGSYGNAISTSLLKANLRDISSPVLMEGSGIDKGRPQ